ncbi:AmpE protein [Klebsiella pneumoniae]|uniref:AmpE protein n=1 Tax=Klebsiella pneumoniae TaxID=573 RepID=A0A378BGA9_KLEPN|nr:AmpE protein [Klebsiella pneumoniae]
MTLFTTLLVLIAERLFKLGEHWQLDHRLEVVFRRIKHFSLPGTLLMTLVAVAGRVYHSASAAGAAV